MISKCGGGGPKAADGRVIHEWTHITLNLHVPWLPKVQQEITKRELNAYVSEAMEAGLVPRSMIPLIDSHQRKAGHSSKQPRYFALPQINRPHVELTEPYGYCLLSPALSRPSSASLRESFSSEVQDKHSSTLETRLIRRKERASKTRSRDWESLSLS